MGKDALGVIADKNSDDAELSRAIQNLGEVTESPGFWNTIASNSDYREFHRGLCVVQLFKRHVIPGMSLGRLSDLLGNPNWLKDEDVEVVGPLRGEIPVTPTVGDTVFALRIFPTMSRVCNFEVYLRVSGKIDRGRFVALLRRQEVDEAVKKAIVLEVGFVAPQPSGVERE